MAREPREGELGGIALIGAGSALVLMTIGGYYLGYVVDRLIHSTPWGAVIGLILGFCVGIWDFYRIASRVMKTQPAPPPAEKNAENPVDKAGNRENNHEIEDE